MSGLEDIQTWACSHWAQQVGKQLTEWVPATEWSSRAINECLVSHASMPVALKA